MQYQVSIPTLMDFFCQGEHQGFSEADIQTAEKTIGSSNYLPGFSENVWPRSHQQPTQSYQLPTEGNCHFLFLYSRYLGRLGGGISGG